VLAAIIMSLKENAIDYHIIVFLQFRPDYYVLTHTHVSKLMKLVGSIGFHNEGNGLTLCE
jgi:hypothetical protein